VKCGNCGTIVDNKYYNTKVTMLLSVQKFEVSTTILDAKVKQVNKARNKAGRKAQRREGSSYQSS
jgi:hypothetical protein